MREGEREKEREREKDIQFIAILSLPAMGSTPLRRRVEAKIMGYPAAM